jgi:hypothetical protein
MSMTGSATHNTNRISIPNMAASETSARAESSAENGHRLLRFYQVIRWSHSGLNGIARVWILPTGNISLSSPILRSLQANRLAYLFASVPVAQFFRGMPKPANLPLANASEYNANGNLMSAKIM